MLWLHQQVAANFKDSAEGWVPSRLHHIQSSTNPGWAHLSHYAKEAHFQPFSLSFVLAVKTQPLLTDLENLLSTVFIKTRRPRRWTEPELCSLAPVLPPGRDLEVQTFGWGSSLTMTSGFRVTYCTLWVIVLGGRSPEHCFLEINHMTWCYRY